MNLVISVAAFGVALLAAANAQAFSQIEPTEGQSDSKEGILVVPLPPLPSADADANRPAPQVGDDSQSDPGRTDDGESPLPPAEEPESGGDLKSKPSSADAKTVLAVPLATEIAYGDDGLPAPVRDLRAKLIAIARAGEIEKLRPYIEAGEDGTVLSFGDVGGDPIEFLKQTSGDGEGLEILAILQEILQAGHVRVEPGADNEIYVWPYFTQVAIDSLSKSQLVELFELVTAGDYEAMKEFGAYNFYRVGISPDGRLSFFVAGD
ncbi:hypothetical protein VSX64_11750 [Aurantimonas sp. C2-6-R+9]|uniref:hypothetical protein n=1 Tax=unclassified Aurantimonas TaxID=2638230 RepID=UPI002E191547|nr:MULTISPECIES: hypothetical protein [unclassified Aurantimonas]MEC5291345.1 hypothetical protein [Aurantimonas sp. C2-3-R2]MEC5381551.1 hypothetical protein [Aurantimonas sp. C2-6-R+9]MEC5412432.1 hypothetical protein [Aurantimonas sp. C2-4-R8]